jgi:hypothetical protein
VGDVLTRQLVLVFRFPAGEVSATANTVIAADIAALLEMVAVTGMVGDRLEDGLELGFFLMELGCQIRQTLKFGHPEILQ